MELTIIGFRTELRASPRTCLGIVLVLCVLSTASCGVEAPKADLQETLSGEWVLDRSQALSVQVEKWKAENASRLSDLEVEERDDLISGAVENFRGHISRTQVLLTLGEHNVMSLITSYATLQTERGGTWRIKEGGELVLELVDCSPVERVFLADGSQVWGEPVPLQVRREGKRLWIAIPDISPKVEAPLTRQD